MASVLARPPRPRCMAAAWACGVMRPLVTLGHALTSPCVCPSVLFIVSSAHVSDCCPQRKPYDVEDNQTKAVKMWVVIRRVAALG
eukprot:8592840-Pyramimonas_sp.AAC.1